MVDIWNCKKKKGGGQFYKSVISINCIPDFHRVRWGSNVVWTSSRYKWFFFIWKASLSQCYSFTKKRSSRRELQQQCCVLFNIKLTVSSRVCFLVTTTTMFAAAQPTEVTTPLCLRLTLWCLPKLICSHIALAYHFRDIVPISETPPPFEIGTLILFFYWFKGWDTALGGFTPLKIRVGTARLPCQTPPPPLGTMSLIRFEFFPYLI